LSADDGEHVTIIFGAPLWPLVQGAFGSLDAHQQLSCTQRNQLQASFKHLSVTGMSLLLVRGIRRLRELLKRKDTEEGVK
jgi:hypothetical protein